MTLQDGQVHESVTETPSGDGVRNFRVVSSPVLDKDGRVTGAIEMVDDITEHLRAQQAVADSEARYRTIFETTGTATMIVEEDMTVSMVNAEFVTESGFSKAENSGYAPQTVLADYPRRFCVARHLSKGSVRRPWPTC